MCVRPFVRPSVRHAHRIGTGFSDTRWRYQWQTPNFMVDFIVILGFSDKEYAIIAMIVISVFLALRLGIPSLIGRRPKIRLGIPTPLKNQGRNSYPDRKCG